MFKVSWKILGGMQKFFKYVSKIEIASFSFIFCSGFFSETPNKLKNFCLKGGANPPIPPLATHLPRSILEKPGPGVSQIKSRSKICCKEGDWKSRPLIHLISNLRKFWKRCWTLRVITKKELYFKIYEILLNKENCIT